MVNYASMDGQVKDLYSPVLATFGQPAFVIFYVLCMVVIGFHLWHGFASAFQSLGLRHKKYSPFHSSGRKDLFDPYSGNVCLNTVVLLLFQSLNLLSMSLQSKVPPGPLSDKWTKYRSTMPLVAPNNKRRIEVIVVGTGLAGASAAASLGELGYHVKCFTFHDSPRRAHSNRGSGGDQPQRRITRTTEIVSTGFSMIR